MDGDRVDLCILVADRFLLPKEKIIIFSLSFCGALRKEGKSDYQVDVSNCGRRQGGGEKIGSDGD